MVLVDRGDTYKVKHRFCTTKVLICVFGTHAKEKSHQNFIWLSKMSWRLIKQQEKRYVEKTYQLFKNRVYLVFKLCHK